MEKVLIDIFIVPQESKAEFLEQTRKVQTFIRSLPGFVEGYIYEQKTGESHYNFLTTAVWESEAAFDNAKGMAAREYQRLGFNPQETTKKLGVEVIRSSYERSPY